MVRLRARLPLDADEAAAAVRRALRGVHGGRQVRRGRQELPRLPALRDRAVHLLRRDDQPRRDLAGGSRQPAAQDPFPAAGDPARGGAAFAVQPRAEHGRRVRLRRRRRDRAEHRLAPAAAAGRDDRGARDRGDDDAVGAVRPLPRRGADLGGGAAAALLRVAGDLRGHDDPEPRPAAPRGDEPDRRDPHPDAPRARGSLRADGDHRPGRLAVARRADRHRRRRLLLWAGGCSCARRPESRRTSEHRPGHRLARAAPRRSRPSSPNAQLAPTRRSPRPSAAPTGSIACTSTSTP